MNLLIKFIYFSIIYILLYSCSPGRNQENNNLASNDSLTDNIIINDYFCDSCDKIIANKNLYHSPVERSLLSICYLERSNYDSAYLFLNKDFINSCRVKNRISYPVTFPKTLSPYELFAIYRYAIVKDSANRVILSNLTRSIIDKYIGSFSLMSSLEFLLIHNNDRRFIDDDYLEELEEFEKIFPKFQRNNYYRLNYYLMTGNDSLILKYSKMLLQEKYQEEVVLSELISYFTSKNEFEKASAYIKIFKSVFPDRCCIPQLKFEYTMGNYQKVNKISEECLKNCNWKDSIISTIYLVISYYKLGDINKVEKIFNNYIMPDILSIDSDFEKWEQSSLTFIESILSYSKGEKKVLKRSINDKTCLKWGYKNKYEFVKELYIKFYSQDTSGFYNYYLNNFVLEGEDL